MEKQLDTTALRIVQLEKLKELQSQQKNLKELQSELERINQKIKKHEKLSEEDTKFIGELGWLSALAVTIASIASSV
jgi:TolA-binding protein